MSRRLLVVAPHATRTGSTKVLLGLLDRLGTALDRPMAVHVQADGPWLDALRSHGAPLEPGEVPAVALVNSSLAAAAVLDLPDGVPALVYVHEVGTALGQLPPDAVLGLRRAERVLAVSEAAAADLRRLEVPAERIAIVPPLLVAPEAPSAEAVEGVRSSLGLAAGHRLVVGCGEASERKGTDLFVEVAAHLSSHPEVHLAWVGRRLRAAARVLDHDVEACGLGGRVTWIDDLDDPIPMLAAADLLVMTSRDDPQPLVPLEAAFVGTPTVAFDVGGLHDLADAGAVASVPFPDTEAMASRVVELVGAPGEGAVLAAACVVRARARQAPEVVVPQVVAELEALIGPHRAP